jgi:hypothetical protein
MNLYVPSEKCRQPIDKGNILLSGKRMEPYQAWLERERGHNLPPYDRLSIRGDQDLKGKTWEMNEWNFVMFELVQYQIE